VHDGDLTADLSQDTFTRAFVAVQAGVQVLMVAWLYRIATNCALEVLRRRRVAQQIPFTDLAVGDAGFDAVNGHAGTFDERIAEADAFTQIWHQLTSRERTALADILESSSAAGEPASAKMRLSRARQHLRQLWQEVAA
jgi:DNA-directed RNA polymerase specialized sigma24 family protein